jgi:hypothetical protein
MDKLPKVQKPTKEEEKWLMSLDDKHQALMRLAYEKLETSFRPEWCHKWIKDHKVPAKNR